MSTTVQKCPHCVNYSFRNSQQLKTHMLVKHSGNKIHETPAKRLNRWHEETTDDAHVSSTTDTPEVLSNVKKDVCDLSLQVETSLTLCSDDACKKSPEMDLQKDEFSMATASKTEVKNVLDSEIVVSSADCCEDEGEMNFTKVNRVGRRKRSCDGDDIGQPAGKKMIDSTKMISTDEGLKAFYRYVPETEQKKYKCKKDQLSGKFACHFCSHLSGYRSDAKRHHRIHTNVQPYQCLLCDFKSIRLRSLKTHIKFSHISQHYKYVRETTGQKYKVMRDRRSGVYKCNYCSHVSALKQNAIIHHRTHTGVQKYHCHHCIYTCKQLTYIERHIQVKHYHIIGVRQGPTTDRSIDGRDGHIICVTQVPITDRGIAGRDQLGPTGTPATFTKSVKGSDLEDQQEYVISDSQKVEVAPKLSTAPKNIKSYTATSGQTKPVVKSSGQFSCAVCSKTFYRRNIAIRHMRCHSKMDMIHCKLSNTKSQTTQHSGGHHSADINEESKRHTRSTNTLSRSLKRLSSGRLRCPFQTCTFTHRREAGIEAHVRSHMKEPSFFCCQCSFNCYLKCTLAKHTKECHSGNQVDTVVMSASTDSECVSDGPCSTSTECERLLVESLFTDECIDSEQDDGAKELKKHQDGHEGQTLSWEESANMEDRNVKKKPPSDNQHKRSSEKDGDYLYIPVRNSRNVSSSLKRFKCVFNTRIKYRQRYKPNFLGKANQCKPYVCLHCQHRSGSSWEMKNHVMIKHKIRKPKMSSEELEDEDTRSTECDAITITSTQAVGDGDEVDETYTRTSLTVQNESLTALKSPPMKNSMPGADDNMRQRNDEDGESDDGSKAENGDVFGSDGEQQFDVSSVICSTPINTSIGAEDCAQDVSIKTDGLKQDGDLQNDKCVENSDKDMEKHDEALPELTPVFGKTNMETEQALSSWSEGFPPSNDDGSLFLESTEASESKEDCENEMPVIPLIPRLRKQPQWFGRIAPVTSTSKGDTDGYASSQSSTSDTSFVGSRGRLPYARRYERIGFSIYPMFSEDAVEMDLKESGQLQCPQCGKNSDTVESNLDHFREHTGHKPYVCNFCGFATGFDSEVKGHVKHQTIDRVKLKELYTLRSNVEQVIVDECQNGEYKCPHCIHRFPSYTTLKHHFRRHTKEKPYHCNLCDYKASMQPLVVQHIKNYHRKCIIICPKRSPDESVCSLSDYVMRVQCRKDSNKLDSTRSARETGESMEEPMYSEGEHPKNAGKQQVFRNHNQLPAPPFVHRIGAVERALKPKMKRESKKYKGRYPCMFCDKIFDDLETSLVHTRLHTGEQTYRCCSCTYTTIYRDKMDKHVKQILHGRDDNAKTAVSSPSDALRERMLAKESNTGSDASDNSRGSRRKKDCIPATKTKIVRPVRQLKKGATRMNSVTSRCSSSGRDTCRTDKSTIDAQTGNTVLSCVDVSAKSDYKQYNMTTESSSAQEKMIKKVAVVVTPGKGDLKPNTKEDDVICPLVNKPVAEIGRSSLTFENRDKSPVTIDNPTRPSIGKSKPAATKPNICERELAGIISTSRDTAMESRPATDCLMHFVSLLNKPKVIGDISPATSDCSQSTYSIRETGGHAMPYLLETQPIQISAASSLPFHSPYRDPSVVVQQNIAKEHSYSACSTVVWSDDSIVRPAASVSNSSAECSLSDSNSAQSKIIDEVEPSTSVCYTSSMCSISEANSAAARSSISDVISTPTSVCVSDSAGTVSTSTDFTSDSISRPATDDTDFMISCAEEVVGAVPSTKILDDEVIPTTSSKSTYPIRETGLIGQAMPNLLDKWPIRTTGARTHPFYSPRRDPSVVVKQNIAQEHTYSACCNASGSDDPILRATPQQDEKEKPSSARGNDNLTPCYTNESDDTSTLVADTRLVGSFCPSVISVSQTIDVEAGATRECSDSATRTQTSCLREHRVDSVSQTIDVEAGATRECSDSATRTQTSCLRAHRVDSVSQTIDVEAGATRECSDSVTRTQTSCLREHRVENPCGLSEKGNVEQPKMNAGESMADNQAHMNLIESNSPAAELLSDSNTGERNQILCDSNTVSRNPSKNDSNSAVKTLSRSHSSLAATKVSKTDSETAARNPSTSGCNSGAGKLPSHSNSVNSVSSAISDSTVAARDSEMFESKSTACNPSASTKHSAMCDCKSSACNPSTSHSTSPGSDSKPLTRQPSVSDSNHLESDSNSVVRNIPKGDSKTAAGKFCMAAEKPSNILHSDSKPLTRHPSISDSKPLNILHSVSKPLTRHPSVSDSNPSESDSHSVVRNIPKSDSKTAAGNPFTGILSLAAETSSVRNFSSGLSKASKRGPNSNESKPAISTCKSSTASSIDVSKALSTPPVYSNSDTPELNDVNQGNCKHSLLEQWPARISAARTQPFHFQNRCVKQNVQNATCTHYCNTSADSIAKSVDDTERKDLLLNSLLPVIGTNISEPNNIDNQLNGTGPASSSSTDPPQEKDLGKPKPTPLEVWPVQASAARTQPFHSHKRGTSMSIEQNKQEHTYTACKKTSGNDDGTINDNSEINGARSVGSFAATQQVCLSQNMKAPCVDSTRKDTKKSAWLVYRSLQRNTKVKARKTKVTDSNSPESKSATMKTSGSCFPLAAAKSPGSDIKSLIAKISKPSTLTNRSVSEPTNQASKSRKPGGAIAESSTSNINSAARKSWKNDSSIATVSEPTNQASKSRKPGGAIAESSTSNINSAARKPWKNDSSIATVSEPTNQASKPRKPGGAIAESSTSNINSAARKPQKNDSSIATVNIPTANTLVGDSNSGATKHPKSACNSTVTKSSISDSKSAATKSTTHVSYSAASAKPSTGDNSAATKHVINTANSTSAISSISDCNSTVTKSSICNSKSDATKHSSKFGVGATKTSIGNPDSGATKYPKSACNSTVTKSSICDSKSDATKHSSKLGVGATKTSIGDHDSVATKHPKSACNSTVTKSSICNSKLDPTKHSSKFGFGATKTSVGDPDSVATKHPKSACNSTVTKSSICDTKSDATKHSSKLGVGATKTSIGDHDSGATKHPKSACNSTVTKSSICDSKSDATKHSSKLGVGATKTSIGDHDSVATKTTKSACYSTSTKPSITESNLSTTKTSKIDTVTAVTNFSMESDSNSVSRKSSFKSDAKSPATKPGIRESNSATTESNTNDSKSIATIIHTMYVSGSKSGITKHCTSDSNPTEKKSSICDSKLDPSKHSSKFGFGATKNSKGDHDSVIVDSDSVATKSPKSSCSSTATKPAISDSKLAAKKSTTHVSDSPAKPSTGDNSAATYLAISISTAKSTATKPAISDSKSAATKPTTHVSDSAAKPSTSDNSAATNPSISISTAKSTATKPAISDSKLAATKPTTHASDSAAKPSTSDNSAATNPAISISTAKSTATKPAISDSKSAATQSTTHVSYSAAKPFTSDNSAATNHAISISTVKSTATKPAISASKSAATKSTTHASDSAAKPSTGVNSAAKPSTGVNSAATNPAKSISTAKSTATDSKSCATKSPMKSNSNSTSRKYSSSDSNSAVTTPSTGESKSKLGATNPCISDSNSTNESLSTAIKLFIDDSNSTAMKSSICDSESGASKPSIDDTNSTAMKSSICDAESGASKPSIEDSNSKSGEIKHSMCDCKSSTTKHSKSYSKPGATTTSMSDDLLEPPAKKAAKRSLESFATNPSATKSKTASPKSALGKTSSQEVHPPRKRSTRSSIIPTFPCFQREEYLAAHSIYQRSRTQSHPPPNKRSDMIRYPMNGPSVHSHSRMASATPFIFNGPTSYLQGPGHALSAPQVGRPSRDPSLMSMAQHHHRTLQAIQHQRVQELEHLRHIRMQNYLQREASIYNNVMLTALQEWRGEQPRLPDQEYQRQARPRHSDAALYHPYREHSRPSRY